MLSMAMATKIKYRVYISFLIIFAIGILFTLWNLFVPPHERAVGKVILPITNNLSNGSVIECSTVIPGLALYTRITDAVLSNTTYLKIKLSNSLLENYSSIEVSMLKGNLFTQVGSLNLTSNQQVYTIAINTSNFEDERCAYRLFIKLVGKNKTKEDITGYFSILNHNKNLMLGDNSNITKIYIPSLNSKPEYILIEKEGIGKLALPKFANIYGINLSKNLRLSRLNLYINNSNVVCFNNLGRKLSAIFYNVSFNKPKIKNNGKACIRNCRIRNYVNNTLVVDFYSPGNFTVVEGLTSRLSIFNPTRDIRKYHIGEKVLFTANYTDLSGKPIYGENIVCQLQLVDINESYEMNFNPVTMLYESSPVLKKPGLFNYRIQCIDAKKDENNNVAYGFYEVFQ